MKDLIEKMAQKYEFQEYHQELNQILAQEFPINIGFLGEYSAGKSTLINAILGKKILPALDKPTSKNVVELNFSRDLPDDDIQYYQKMDNGKAESINSVEFGDFAMGYKEGLTALQVPAVGRFRDGICLIDTPGLQSLDQMDEDITFGYLPFLDAAIVCIDVNHGSLTASICKFLTDEQVKPFIHNVIFALTYADTKTKSALPNIRANIISQVQELYNELDISANAESKVFCIDSHTVIEQGHDCEYMQNMFKVMEKNIFQRNRNIQAERRTKEIHALAKQIDEALTDYKANLTMDDSDLQKKEEELKNDMARHKKEKPLIDDQMRTLRKKLERELENIGKKYAAIMANSQNGTFVDPSQEMIAEIQSAVESHVRKSFEKINIESYSPNIDNVMNLADTITRIANGTKMVANFALMSFLVPGGGLAGNAVQGTAGSATGRAARTAATKVAKKTSKHVALSKMQTLLTGVNKINPVEHVGNFATKVIGGKLIASRLQNEMDILADDLTTELQDMINIEYIAPLEQLIVEMQTNVQRAQDERKALKQSHKARHKELDDDIMHLRKQILEAEDA